MEAPEGIRIATVTASFGGTINLGNYENFKIDLSMTAVLPENVAPGEVAANLLADIRETVRHEVAKLRSFSTGSWLRATDVKQELPPVEAPALPEQVEEDEDDNVVEDDFEDDDFEDDDDGDDSDDDEDNEPLF